jgi:hypothetical protein
MKKPSTPVDDIYERIQAEYADRFFAAGATGFNAWGNGALLGVEVNFGKTFGPSFVASVRYARRDGWLGLFGRLLPFRSLEEAERELREQIESYLLKLQAGHRPGLFRP